MALARPEDGRIGDIWRIRGLDHEMVVEKLNRYAITLNSISEPQPSGWGYDLDDWDNVLYRIRGEPGRGPGRRCRAPLHRPQPGERCSGPGYSRDVQQPRRPQEARCHGCLLSCLDRVGGSAECRVAL